MHPTWCVALVASKELFQFVAVFIPSAPTLPSPIKGEGIQGGKSEGGDATSLDGGSQG